MNIINLPIDSIIPYERNPRRNDGAVEAVAASIREFGFKVPIVVDADNVIVTGHTRHKAAQRLGLTECPCIRADDLTPEQVRAYRLADNKVAELAEWNFDLLAAELAELPDFGMDEFGFEGLLKDSAPILPDDFTLCNNQTYITNGDEIKLGIHTLVCGDSSKIEIEADTVVFDHNFDDIDILRFIPEPSGVYKNLLLYSDAFHFDCVKTAIEKKWIPYFEFIWDTVQSWYVPNRPLANHKTCFYFSGETGKKFDTEKSLVYDGKERKIRKVRNSRGLSLNIPYRFQKHLTTVFRYPNTILKKNGNMKYEKPIQWTAAILRMIKAEKVFDCFAGGGSVLIACEQLGIEWHGVEIDPVKCQMIIDRYKKFTEKSDEHHQPAD